MAFRLSNSLIGILNLATFLLSIPILVAGIWLGHRSDGTECEKYLSAPVIALGVFLLLVSLAGLIGACCRVTWLLWVYLLAMFVLIVVLFGVTVFAFVVTNKGAGEAVSDRGYKEYRLGDYSNWLQKRVENNKDWNRIRSCLQDSKVCKTLQDKQETLAQFMSSDLSPIESGCCKPPTSCGFTYESGTNWTKTATNSTSDPDCNSWDNSPSTLCYGCQSCKAGVPRPPSPLAARDLAAVADPPPPPPPRSGFLEWRGCSGWRPCCRSASSAACSASWATPSTSSTRPRTAGRSTSGTTCGTSPWSAATRSSSSSPLATRVLISLEVFQMLTNLFLKHKRTL